MKVKSERSKVKGLNKRHQPNKLNKLNKLKKQVRGYRQGAIGRQ